MKDDVELCKYIRTKKLGIDDMPKIVKSYVPNRKGNLVFDGKIIDSKSLKEESLQINPLEGDKSIFLEFAKQTSDLRNKQIMIGLTIYKKLFSYGFGIGYTKAKFVDTNFFINDNIISHGLNTPHLPISDKYYNEASELTLKGYYGLYHTLNIGKYYLIPSAYANFGLRSVVSSDSQDVGLVYGPKLQMDLGKEMSLGNIIFIGVGYEYTMCKPFEEIKLDNYKPFESYNRFSVRLSYKF